MAGFLVSLFWLLLFLGGSIYLAYQRIGLRTATAAAAVAVAAYTVYTFSGNGLWYCMLLLWVALAAMIVPNLVELRREKITRPLLNIYRTMLPSMSDTEREALEAGNVWWDGELFSGMPDWDRLMSFPAPQLSDEEQAFFDGPCEQLCTMLDDWDICHNRVDMPKEVWDFIIKHKFFAMIIPKAIRRAGIFSLRERDGNHQAGQPQSDGVVDRRRAKLARPGRTVVALRHRGAKTALPARACCRH